MSIQVIHLGINALPSTQLGQRDDRRDPSGGNIRQLEIGEKAKRDAESEQVDTDRYNTSGNEADPP